MDKRYFNRKVFAFTLAEMMVILAVFSVIAAATLPVITAHQKLGNSDNATTGDFAGVDKWTYSNLGLSNIKAGTYSTVAIGMEPTSSDVPIGVQPQLMINKNGNVTRTSHVTFLGTANSNVYYNGRLSMAGENVAFGNDALWSPVASGTGVTSVKDRNVIIGTKAAYRDSSNTTPYSYNLQDTVAIGYRAFYGGSGLGNVVIGTYAGYGQYGPRNVMMGTLAGYYSGTSLKGDSIYVGSYAGFGQYSILYNSINIGHNAGRYQYGSSTYPINIGYYSGLYMDGTFYHPVNIGTYAGRAQNAYSSAKTSYPINIGYNAGYLQNGLNGYLYCPINLGTNAGYHQYSSKNYGYSASINYAINIGMNTGSYQYSMINGSSSEVIDGVINIGYYAGYYQYATYTNASLAYNNGKLWNSINIGAYAGYYQHAEYIHNATNIGNFAGAYQRAPSNYELAHPINIGTYAGYRSVVYGNAASRSGGSPVTCGAICIGSYACSQERLYNVIRIGKGGFKTKDGVGYNTSTYALSIVSNVFASYLYISNPRVSYIGGYYHRPALIYNYSVGSINYSTTMPWAPIGGQYIGYSNTSNSSNKGLLTVEQAPFLISGGSLPTDDPNYDYSKTAIVLYSNHIYGPTTTMKVYSDKRLKENIKPSKYSLKDLRKINIYEYNFKDDKTKTPRIGVIAQELQKIIPQAVTKNNEGYLAINAEWINYTVINSIKELANQVEIIQQEFTSYVKEFVMLAKRVNTLEKQIKNLEQENKVLLTSVDKAYRKAKAKK